MGFLNSGSTAHKTVRPVLTADPSNKDRHIPAQSSEHPIYISGGSNSRAWTNPAQAVTGRQICSNPIYKHTEIPWGFAWFDFLNRQAPGPLQN